MSNYEDEQSEDGELARSPVADEMDFSLSDEDHHDADSLVIKPPQAVLRPSHKDKRSHKKAGKDRYKESSRKEKKHTYRERDKNDKPKRETGKQNEREDMSKEYYREKQYYREKEAYNREKEMYREKEMRERDMYRERDMRDKDVYREKEQYREMYRENTSYRDVNKQPYRDNSFRDSTKSREGVRDKEMYKEKESERERAAYINREKQYKNMETEKRRQADNDRIESRLRMLAEDSINNLNNEKENKDKAPGDKELEDLRTRLLSKRLQGQDKKELPDKELKVERQAALDKTQQERRNKFIEAEREMEKRRQESRNELEARRQERRRRGKKRSVSPQEIAYKKSRGNSPDAVVMVSDSSDIEMKSDSPHSKTDDGDSNTESEESSSSESETDSGKSNDEEDKKSDSDSRKAKLKEKPSQKSKSCSPKSDRPTPSSKDSRRSHSRSKSRSRSHSFSPPPPGENGKPNEDTPNEEEARIREEAISALPPYYPALQGCRSVEEFQCLNRIEEGTYGVVYRARDKTTDEIVALKRLKMEKEREGFPITSLREINTLLKGQHPNIVTVREIVVGSNMDKIFIVMDYVEHDLKSLMETMRGKKQVFLPGEVKCLMTQLLKAVHHLHDNWILHRDLKTSNLLLSHKGILKVGDFGLAREYGSPLRQYTPIVVTLWYRAPELLLCCKEYSTHIDMWSVGCIFAEFVTMHPLFPGKSEVDQLNRIFKDLGTPSESVWPGYNELPAVQKMTFAEHPPGGLRQRVGQDLLSETGLSLLRSFLNYDPARRISADAALEHAYFKEQPVAIDPAMFPTWPAKSEGNRRSTHSPRPPAGGGVPRDDSDESTGFLLQAGRSVSMAPGFSLKF